MLLLSTKTNNTVVRTDERTDGWCVKLYFLSLLQGRRRVLKSGPAEEIIECRRHERGRTREWDPSPLSLVGLGGLPRKIK